MFAYATDRRLAEAAKFGLGQVAQPGRFGTLREAVLEVVTRERMALAQ